MDRQTPAFEVRGTVECGWNIFHRKGFSNDPRDIAVNYDYLNHLSDAGVNWAVVFRANSAGFGDAWKEAVRYAHSVDVKVARAIYGFSGGGSEYTMAEPDAPEHLLRPSSRGPNTALCPHDEETREWMANILSERLAPGVDGIDIEPAREIGRNCICADCLGLRPFEWDVFVINLLTDRIHSLDPKIEVLLHLKMDRKKTDKQTMSEELHALRKEVRHIFAWGADEETALVDWLDADPRFEHFAKLGRVLLFPEGIPSEISV